MDLSSLQMTRVEYENIQQLKSEDIDLNEKCMRQTNGQRACARLSDKR